MIASIMMWASRKRVDHDLQVMIDGILEALIDGILEA